MRAVAENYKKLYDSGKMTKEMLANVVTKYPTLLTKEEYKEITDEDYKV